MIYISSDWHLKRGHLNSLSLLSQTKPGDLVIVLGDFADDWEEQEGQFWFIQELSQYPAEILIVDGNHEDFKKINRLPEKEWHKIKVHQLGERLYHVLRGQVLEWEDKRFWLMGGGYSGAGYIMRYPEVWQEEEMPTQQEREMGLQALVDVGGKVDYILTHTAPLTMIRRYNLSEEYSAFNVYLDDIAKYAQFNKWYFGHFHENKLCNNKYEIIYQGLKQIK